MNCSTLPQKGNLAAFGHKSGAVRPYLLGYCTCSLNRDHILCAMSSPREVGCSMVLQSQSPTVTTHIFSSPIQLGLSFLNHIAFDIRNKMKMRFH